MSSDLIWLNEEETTHFIIFEWAKRKICHGERCLFWTLSLMGIYEYSICLHFLIIIFMHFLMRIIHVRFYSVLKFILYFLTTGNTTMNTWRQHCTSTVVNERVSIKELNKSVSKWTPVDYNYLECQVVTL